jgi:hypothetical protein
VVDGVAGYAATREGIVETPVRTKDQRADSSLRSE